MHSAGACWYERERVAFPTVWFRADAGNCINGNGLVSDGGISLRMD